MSDKDDWGRDPQVRHLRGVFAEIEKAQADFLRRLHVSPLDYRLRRVREAALTLFERTGMEASRKGIVRSEEETAILYVYCLARILAANRISVPAEELPGNERIEEFVREALK